MRLTELIGLVDPRSVVYVEFPDSHVTFSGLAGHMAKNFANGTSVISNGEIVKVKPVPSPFETFVYLLIEVKG